MYVLTEIQLHCNKKEIIILKLITGNKYYFFLDQGSTLMVVGLPWASENPVWTSETLNTHLSNQKHCHLYCTVRNQYNY